jgi:hypothetical protein
MKDLYDQRQGINLLLNEKLLLSDFDFKVEKNNAIQSIKELVGECNQRWGNYMSLRNRNVENNKKFFLDLGYKMLEIIFAHLGVVDKNMSFMVPL